MISVFIRPATPGCAKTRLIPALGKQGAAELYRALAQDTIEQACAVRARTVTLWVAGAIDDPELSYAPPAVARVRQPDTDLGTRMLTALEAGLRLSAEALVLGSDSPGLHASVLGRAFAQLSAADVVLGPSADGGYCFIAARRTRPGMFDNVRMSSAQTLQDTLRACRSLGLSVALTPPWFDVDTPADLTTLRGLLAVAPALAPRTRDTLSRLDRMKVRI